MTKATSKFGLSATMLLLVWSGAALLANPANAAAGWQFDIDNKDQFKAAVSIKISAAMMASDDAQLDELEKTVTEFRTKNSHFSTGEWKLSTFYESIIADPNDPRFEPFLTHWAERWPGSPTPHLLRAQLLLYGLSGGYAASSVVYGDDQSKPISSTNLALLQGALNLHKDVADADPYWYVIAAHAARLAAKDANVFSAIVAEGLSKHPNFTPIFDAGTDYFLPKRSGDSSKLEEWARNLASQTAVAGSSTAYARVYWHAFEADLRRDIISKSLIDWSRFKLSAAALLQENPSPQNHGKIALIACLAGDRDETRRLFATQIEPLSFYPWLYDAERDACRKWANQRVWEILFENASNWIALYGHELLQLLIWVKL